MKKEVLIIFWALLFFVLVSGFSSASTTITDTSINTTGNLTIGEKIVFALGGILDNIISGWITLTGNLNITGNATITGDSFKVDNKEVCLEDGTNCQLNVSGSTYLYDNSGILEVNETKLNETIIQKTIFPMGEIYVNGNGLITTISTQNTWTLINSVWEGNSESMMFQNYSNGTLVYMGEETMFFHIASTLSIKSTSNNERFRASIFKNGVLLPGSQIQHNLGSSGAVASSAIHVATSLSTGDYLNVYVLNEDSSNNFNVTYANLFAMGMRME